MRPSTPTADPQPRRSAVMVDLLCTADMCRLELGDVLVCSDTDRLARLATFEFESNTRRLLDETINN